MFNHLIPSDYQIPTVYETSHISFSLSLNTDPVNGPYTTSVVALMDQQISIRLRQLTAGPKCNVSVSFGDGSTDTVYILMSSSVVINVNYSSVGTYRIVATPIYTSAPAPNATTSVSNDITVNVTFPERKLALL